MASLLESDSSDEDTKNNFKINENYAKSYNRFREKEIYQRLKDKYGEDAAVSKYREDEEQFQETSSSSEEEDENAEALTEEVEKDFFKTLACLKKKDPRIYDGNTEFFKASKSGKLASAPTSAKKKGKEKKMFLGDLERKVMMEKEGKFDDLEDEHLASTSRGKSYVEEQQELKESLKVSSGDDDDDDDGFFKTKNKSKKELEKEESDYKLWLAGQEKDETVDDKTKSDLKGLKDFWDNKNLDEKERFLKDYILKKRYLDADGEEDDDDDDDDVNYEHQVHDSDENLSEDERTVEKMEDFEHKFNFRFEEPDQDFIKRYPRTVQDSMRRENNKRKKKREEVQTRKTEEKEKRQQELKQLKSLKRKEIMEKIDKLKKIAGNDEIPFQDQDLEDDFDPKMYDKRMAEVFAKYDEVPVENEDEKPDITDLVDSDFEEELEMENWDEWTGNENENEEPEELDVNDPNFVMDCDFHKELQKELIESTKSKKRRRKSKFAEVLEKKKPIFNPDKGDTYEKYLEEYYKLDYEDIVAGMPCRFKYRNVQSNDFGLSTEEILSAPDRELNSWCSLKKTCQYRSNEEEQADVRIFKNRGKNLHFKKKVLPSLFTENPEKELEAERDKKSKRAQKKRKQEPEEDLGSQEEQPKEENLPPPPAKKKKKKSKKNKANPELKKSDSKKEKNKNNQVNAELKMSDERMKAYGINPNQLKRKAKKQKYKQAKS